MNELVGIVLAAGHGTRLRPLTHLRPKAMCPVNNVPLVDIALDRLEGHVSETAVNVHAGRALLENHLWGRTFLSFEESAPLGTAGALGKLRNWIAGRDVLLANVDAWHQFDLSELVASRTGESPSLMVVKDPERGDFEQWRYVGAAIIPWSVIVTLPDSFAGLYDTCFAPHFARGCLQLVLADGLFFDCGTPSDYLAANLAASGGKSVIGDHALNEGELTRSVVWPKGEVHAGEHLTECIRVGHNLTISAPLSDRAIRSLTALRDLETFNRGGQEVS